MNAYVAELVGDWLLREGQVAGAAGLYDAAAKLYGRALCRLTELTFDT